MNYKQSYGFELTERSQHFVFTPIVQRVVFNIIAAFSTNMAMLIRGPACVGKAETFCTLAGALAKPLFVWRFIYRNSSELRAV